MELDNASCELLCVIAFIIIDGQLQKMVITDLVLDAKLYITIRSQNVEVTITNDIATQTVRNLTTLSCQEGFYSFFITTNK